VFQDLLYEEICIYSEGISSGSVRSLKVWVKTQYGAIPYYNILR